MANYLMLNMLVPGQVEKWITYTNINKTSLRDVPIKLFKAAADTLSLNYIDNTSKAYVVNMTYMQSIVGKLLQKFLDADTVSKMFISSSVNDPDVIKYISPSQLEEKHGGSAPNATQYWPPIMPEYTDFSIEEAPCQVLQLENYNEFYMENP